MSYKADLQGNNTDLQAILSKVNALPDALDTSDATATAADIASGKTAYVNGVKVTGEVVIPDIRTGTFATGALSSTLTSVTIPDLIGKTNFVLYAANTDRNASASGKSPVHCLFSNDGGSTIHYRCQQSSNYLTRDGTTGDVTYNASTGTFATGNFQFCGTMNYVAW